MDDLTLPGDAAARLHGFVGQRRDLLIVAGVVVALLLGAALVWQRRAVVNIAPPSVSQASPEDAASSATLYVHVAGAVRSPGLFELPDGARVADAVAAAGGARKAGDLDAVNLAQLLTDGMKIEVPRAGEQSSAAAESAAADETSVVSLNSADRTALETIPGIGPVTAAAILSHRAELGGFSALAELLDVTGIGPATYEAMLPYVSL
ncbi:MAG: ComEA family DNA-binding protein [Actinomycetota bacterium]